MGVFLQPAELADLPQIAVLMNAAFRDTTNERAWCVESGFIKGERTNERLLREEIVAGAQLLITRDEMTQAIQGCVSLRGASPGLWYLGSLTVDPTLQNLGFGRELLQAAETYAMEKGARSVEITVMNVRDILIAWYQRRGYMLTGVTRPFPYGDDRFGTPTRDDLEFVVLEKQLSE
jgi:ribosomal protein S18 acetylase RimI-like enzyme